MKLLFKPFKILFILLTIILLIPLIILGLLWRPVNPPSDYNEQAISVQTVISESIDDFLENEEDREPLSLSINAQAINTEIRNQLLQQMEANEESQYLINQEPVFIQGVWVDMKKDTINITMGVHVDTSILIFKTRLLLSFEIVDTEGVIVLRLKKLTIGNLPLAWSSRFANSIYKRLAGEDLETMIQDQIGTLGEFSLKDRTLKIDLRNLAKEVPEHEELIVIIVDLIYSEDLLSLGINKNNDEFAFGLTVNLDKLEDKTLPLVIPEHLKINNELELELFLKTQIDLDESKLITTLLNNKPEFRLSSLDINRVLDYFVRTNMEETLNNNLAEFNIYQDYEFIVGNPYLEIENNLASVNVPVILSSPTGGSFTTMVKLTASVSVENEDLILEIDSLRMGELTLDNEFINQIMAAFPVENEFITGTKFVLTDFSNYFDQFGLQFKNLTFDNSDLVLEYEVEGLSDALDSITNNPNISPVVLDKIEEVLEDIENEDKINELVDLIESLPEEERETLFNELQAALENLFEN